VKLINHIVSKKFGQITSEFEERMPLKQFLTLSCLMVLWPNALDSDLLAVEVMLKVTFGHPEYKNRVLKVPTYSRLLVKSRVEKSFIYPFLFQ
jgi:hypothetical protein